MHRGILICEEDFDVSTVTAAMRQRNPAAIGALVTFTGLVRDRNPVTGDNSAVSTLTLEHYPGMTEASIDKILDQAEQRWPLLDVQVIHRVGTDGASGANCACCGCFGSSRCRFCRRRICYGLSENKGSVLEKEHTEKGTHWVQSTKNDAQRAQHSQQRSETE